MALKLNWKNTQLQQQPATQRAFAALTGNQRIVPVHILPMADGAGVAPVDVVDGFTTLTTPVGTVDVDYSFGAPAYGLYNGVDHESRLALEISSASGGVVATDPAFLDPGHKSFGIYLQYRIVEGDSGATVSIMRKGGDHTTPAVDDVTWQLHYDETTHRVYMALAYNSTGVGSFAVNAYVGGTVDDAAYHWLYAKVNMVAKTVEVFGDTDAGTSTDISTMVDAIEAQSERFENTTDLVEIGNNSDLDANDNPMQICYMAILRGSSSDLFTRAVGQAMWVHGKDQNLVDTGKTIVYTRTSRVGYPIAADKVAMWSGSAGGGDVQVPLEFNENWGGDDFLSLGCHPSTENLLGDANDLTAWTTVTASVNEAELVSERGFREMDVVDATSNGGYVYKDITGLTNGVTYRVSFYARTQTGSHTATVEATEDDLATVTGTVTTPGLDTSRARYTFTFDAVGTSTRIKLFGGTAATQTNTGFHCVMVTEGTAYGPCIYNDIDQDGTTETLAVQYQSLTVAGNALTSPDEGAIWAAYIQSVQDTGAIRKIVDIHSDAENEDRRFMEILAIGTQDSGTYNALGVSYQATTAHAALTANTEYNRSMQWRRKANLASGAYTLEDDITAPTALTQTVTGTANTEGTGGHVTIFIACDYNDLQQLSGLQSLHLYAHEVRSFNIVPAVQTETTVDAAAFSSDPGISNGITDHGALSGLADDDHTQYLRTDGTRASTGAQTFNAGIVIGAQTASDILVAADTGVSTSDLALVTAGYLDGLYLRDTDAYTHPNHSGDVTSVADGAQTIAANVVTNAKAAQMVANTVKSNATVGTANASDLAMGASTMLARLAAGNIVAATPTEIRTLLNVEDGSNDYTHPNHSGDVTSVADGAQTIAAGVVTNTKLANMATQTFKGRTTAGTGAPEDLTVTQATALLNNFTSTLKGLVPLSGGGTTNFLRADGTWAAAAGGGGNTLDGAYDQGGAGAGRTITVDTDAVHFSQPAINAGGGSVTEIFRVTGGVITDFNDYTDPNDVTFNLDRVVELRPSVGGLVLASAINIAAPNYTCTGTGTIQIAATLYIDAAPRVNGGMTVNTGTNQGAYAIFVDAGQSRFDGDVIAANGADFVIDHTNGRFLASEAATGSSYGFFADATGRAGMSRGGGTNTLRFRTALSTDTFQWYHDGTQSMLLTNASLRIRPLGSSGAPSLTLEDTTTGWYRNTTNEISFTQAGFRKHLWRNVGDGQSVHYANGTEAIPVLVVGRADIDSGFWSPAANTVALSTGGVEVVRYDANQNSTFAGTIVASGHVGSNKVTLTDAATIATNCVLGNTFQVTLGGNRTLGLPTSPVSGFVYTWVIEQDATGGRSLTFHSTFKFPGYVNPTILQEADDISTMTAVYDGSDFRVLSHNFADSNYPAGHLSGLEMQYKDATSVNIREGNCTDSTGLVDIINTGTLNPSLAASGVNGLDTGAEASNTWYAVYVIDGASGSTAGLLSLSFTAPTMPAGYHVWRRVGAVLNDNSSNLAKWWSRGNGPTRKFMWDSLNARTTALSGGTASAWTNVSCTASAPPSATEVQFQYLFTNNSSNTRFFELTIDGGTDELFKFKPAEISSDQYIGDTGMIPCSSAQVIDYRLSATGGASLQITLYTQGWMDEL